MDMCFAKLILDNETQEMWVQAVKSHESKNDVNESTLEEAQKLVPREYWEYLDIFSKSKSEHMPLRKPWDHGIDLKEDFPPKKGRLIPLSVDEQKEVEAFLDDHCPRDIFSLLTPSKPLWSSLYLKRMERSAWFRTIVI